MLVMFCDIYSVVSYITLTAFIMLMCVYYADSFCVIHNVITYVNIECIYIFILLIYYVDDVL